MATGDRRYYEVAHSFLVSYRWFSRHPLPFAIICDEENELTDDFDLVVHIDNPLNSFLDKLRLPELAPFDETIFIDSDCLAYRDLNGLWPIFAKSGDFAPCGIEINIDYRYGWFRKEDTGIFQDKVKFTMILQGGIYYMRKGRLEEFSKTCRYILDHYDSFKFSGYDYNIPVDEQIIALACAVHGFHPARPYDRMFCYYPLCGSVKADILKGRLSYKYGPEYLYSQGRYLIHWSFLETQRDLYKDQVAALTKAVSEGRRPNLLWEVRGRLLDFFYPVVRRTQAALSRLIPCGLKEWLYKKLFS